MTTHVARRPTDVVRAAFDAYLAQDRRAMEALLADDFTFTSPQGDHIDRGAFLERCFPSASRLRCQRMLQVIEDGDGAVFARYEYELLSGARHRNVEHITVRDGRLVETEVYFGGPVGPAAGPPVAESSVAGSSAPAAEDPPAAP